MLSSPLALIWKQLFSTDELVSMVLVMGIAAVMLGLIYACLPYTDLFERWTQSRVSRGLSNPRQVIYRAESGYKRTTQAVGPRRSLSHVVAAMSPLGRQRRSHCKEKPPSISDVVDVIGPEDAEIVRLQMERAFVEEWTAKISELRNVVTPLMRRAALVESVEPVQGSERDLRLVFNSGEVFILTDTSYDVRAALKKPKGTAHYQIAEFQGFPDKIALKLVQKGADFTVHASGTDLIRASTRLL